VGRPTGTLNKDHADTRADLARRLAQRLLTAEGKLPSLRTLADGAGVDPGTLRHYFSDRTGAVKAAMETLAPLGDEFQATARMLSGLPPEDALKTLLGLITRGWPGVLGQMHAMGFVEGLVDGALGQAYLAAMLEPTLAIVEELLTTLSSRNALNVPEARFAALALVSPVLVACFHQVQLEGRACRPLDLDAFVEAHVRGFMLGHAVRS
jgi:AcrR family transcriptional regulator